MPLLLWPFPSGGPPPPVTPRVTDGKVFLINSLTGEFIGPPPLIGEACTLVFYPIANGLPHSPLDFTFISPNGTVKHGDSDFAFVSTLPITEIFPRSDFPVGSLVYTFAPGELNRAGVWTVQVTSGGYRTNVANFTVVAQLGLI